MKNNKDYNNIKELKKEAEACVNEFNSCQRYMNNLGIIEDAKRSVNMYEGRHYVDYKKINTPFENPVLNVFANIIDGKLSSVCSKDYKLDFVIENDQYSTNKLTRFTQTVMKELNQKKTYKKLVLDTLLKGTAIKYDYWNTDKIGIYGDIEGGVDTTVVDIRDIAVSNPREADIQKQDWIIVRTRESVSAVKKATDTMSKTAIDKNIVSTNFKSSNDRDIERENSDRVYSYTKFFKQDNEVYFQKFTDEILYQFPRATNPKINEKVIRERQKKEENTESNYSNDALSNTNFDKPDNQTQQEAYENKFKASRYPFVKMVFFERDNSFFGVSYGAQLIGIQKLINQLVATTMVTALKSVMPTIVVKAGALGGQKLDFSKPNGVITDYSGSGVNDAIKVLNTGTVPTTHYELAQSITSYAKDVYRANDILNDGRQLGANASGALVANLKALQDSPVQQWQEEYTNTLAEEGKVLEMFFKSYYHNKPFTYELSRNELTDFNAYARANKKAELENGFITDTFESDDYLETPFNISVIVSETSKASEATSLAIIETLFLNGSIANLSLEHLEMLTTLLPENVFPQKDDFKRMVVAQKNSQMSQLQQQNAMLQEQLQQLTARQQAVEQEYTTKVNQYNDTLKSLKTIANMSQKSTQKQQQTPIANKLS